jgi:hypothetical protein
MKIFLFCVRVHKEVVHVVLREVWGGERGPLDVHWGRTYGAQKNLLTSLKMVRSDR